MTTTLDEAEDLIAEFRDECPDGFRLARLVSPAVKIDSPLLRHLRLKFLGATGADIEASLWFSDLVQSYSPLGIVFQPAVATLLRNDLAQEPALLQEAYEQLERVHRNESESIQLEEHITFLALQSDPDPTSAIEQRLHETLRAMRQDAKRGAEIARWALRALPRLPAKARDTEAAVTLALGAAQYLGGQIPLALSSETGFPNALRWILKAESIGTRKLGLRGDDRILEFVDPNEAGAATFELPGTTPGLVEFLWNAGGSDQRQLVQAEPGARVKRPGAGAPLTLRTLAGDEYAFDFGKTAELAEDVSQPLDLEQKAEFEVDAGDPGVRFVKIELDEARWGIGYYVAPDQILTATQFDFHDGRTFALPEGRISVVEQRRGLVPGSLRIDGDVIRRDQRLALVRVPHEDVPELEFQFSDPKRNQIGSRWIGFRDDQNRIFGFLTKVVKRDDQYTVTIEVSKDIQRGVLSVCGCPVMVGQQCLGQIESIAKDGSQAVAVRGGLITDFLVDTATERHKSANIFISYRKDDSRSESRGICTALRSRGANVFWDNESIDAGDTWPDVIRRHLLQSDTVLVVIKTWNHWLGVDKFGSRRIDNEGDWVRREVAAALNHNKRVVPVLVGENKSLAPAESLPEDLRELTERKIFHIRDSVDKWDIDLKALVESVLPDLPIDEPATDFPEIPVEQVFVSSTASDLSIHRQAVDDAVRDANMESVMFEKTGASDQAVLSESLDRLAGCDIYLAIVAWRYGFVPEGRQHSLIEMEYDRAKELSIPRLIFMLDESTPWPRDMIDAPNDHINEFRKRLMKENECTTFESPDELRKMVSEALRALPESEHQTRQSTSSPTIEQLDVRQTEFQDPESRKPTATPGVDSVGVLFPGQGAETIGMGRWLCESYTAARALFDIAGNVLGYDLADLCFNGPAEKLDATEFIQPALFVVGIAAATVLADDQPELISSVRGTAGLSLGEYTAVCFAGGLEFVDALRLVQRRGQAMQAAADTVDSGMASVLGLSLDVVERLCEETRIEGEVLSPANQLVSGNIVVSGHHSAIERFEPAAMEAGAMKVIRLSVAGAFHTPLMDPAAAELSATLEEMPIMDTRIPVYSNVDAKAHQSASEIRDLLSRQVREPVLWEDSIRNMITGGIDRFMEVGTGRVLRGTVRRIARKMPIDSFGDG